MSDIKQIKIVDIRRNGGTQPRAELNHETVQEYAEAIGKKAEFPPVTVFYDGVEYWLADGFHRVAAHEKCGCVDIRADVRAGLRRDAVLHSFGVNSDHGLRRTNADKRRVVMAMLEDAEWGSWSNSEIARRCKVSDLTVGRMRKSILNNVEDSERIDQPQTRTVQRGGNVYEQKIPQRAPIPQPPPDAGADAHARANLPDPTTGLKPGQVASDGPTAPLAVETHHERGLRLLCDSWGEAPTSARAEFFKFASAEMGAGNKEASRGTRIPKGWAPSEGGMAYARDKGLTAAQIDAQFENFVNFWTAKSGANATKLDWQATWRTWVARNAERLPQNRNAQDLNGGFQSKGEKALAAFRQRQREAAQNGSA